MQSSSLPVSLRRKELRKHNPYLSLRDLSSVNISGSVAPASNNSSRS